MKNPVPVSKSKNLPPVKWAEPMNSLLSIVFDYGDNWEFDIVVMHGSEESTSDIQVIERKGEAPEQYPDYEDIY